MTAYDVNDLFQVFSNFLPGFADANYCHLAFTSNSSYDPDRSGYSYEKQYSGMMGMGGEYRPGNVLDILLSKGGRSYFASIFFDTERRVIQHRLVRLAAFIRGPLKDAMESLKPHTSTEDSHLDEGRIPFGDDYLGAAKTVTDWMRYQIEQDPSHR